MASGRERMVFEAEDIGCVSWTNDGKLLLLQSKQTLAQKEDKDESGATKPTTWPSYPEVWLLEPKGCSGR